MARGQLSVQVPSIEHNGKVTGESLDVLKYLDSHFDGPKLEPTVSLSLFARFLPVDSYPGSHLSCRLLPG